MDIEKEQIRKLIEQEHSFYFTTVLMSEHHKEQFHWIVDTILAKYKKDKNYRIFIYAVVKELIINGIKANSKSVYAEHFSQKILSEDMKEKKIEFDKLKEILSDSHPKHEQFNKMVKEKNIKIKIFLSFSEMGILFVVINENPLSYAQNLRVREKLSIANDFDSVLDFFRSDKVDNSEGEGLGFATIFSMMKQFGINNRYLIFHESLESVPIPDKPDDGTAVSFFIPFDPEIAKIHLTESYFGVERRKFDKNFWWDYIKKNSDIM